MSAQGAWGCQTNWVDPSSRLVTPMFTTNELENLE